MSRRSRIRSRRSSRTGSSLGRKAMSMPTTRRPPRARAARTGTGPHRAPSTCGRPSRTPGCSNSTGMHAEAAVALGASPRSSTARSPVSRSVATAANRIGQASIGSRGSSGRRRRCSSSLRSRPRRGQDSSAASNRPNCRPAASTSAAGTPAASTPAAGTPAAHRAPTIAPTLVPTMRSGLTWRCSKTRITPTGAWPCSEPLPSASASRRGGGGARRGPRQPGPGARSGGGGASRRAPSGARGGRRFGRRAMCPRCRCCAEAGQPAQSDSGGSQQRAARGPRPRLQRVNHRRAP